MFYLDGKERVTRCYNTANVTDSAVNKTRINSDLVEKEGQIANGKVFLMN